MPTPGPAHKLSAFLLNPVLIFPHCAPLQPGMLSITLSEAGFLRTLGNTQPKFHYIQPPQNHTVIHSLSGRNPQGFFGTISFLLILIPIPFQPPQHRSSSFCHSVLTPQILQLCKLPQLEQCWHGAQGNKPIRAY